MTIPMMMVVGPALGYFLGKWLDEKFGTDPYLMVILALFGFVASVKETFRQIKQISDETKDDGNDF